MIYNGLGKLLIGTVISDDYVILSFVNDEYNCRMINNMTS